MFAKRSQSVRNRPPASAIVRGGSHMPGRETRNCRQFLRFALQKCQQSQGSGGSWSRNAELSSLLDSPRVFAFQKCQQSQGSGGVVVAKPRTVVTFGLASGLRVSKVSTITGIGGGRGCEAQNRRHFWTRLRSSRLKSVNSHRDRGGRGREARTVVTFEIVSGLRVAKVSTVTGIGGVVVAKRRTVVTFGLASGLRVSKVSTVTGIGGVVVAKPELSSLLDSSRVVASQKCQQSQGSGGRFAKRRIVVTFGLAFGERRGERREEKREMRGEKRGERREERREERDERREKRGEKRDERREERRERREKRRERREERGEESGWREKRGERRGERGKEREVRR